jgi:hypothetical protein
MPANLLSNKAQSLPDPSPLTLSTNALAVPPCWFRVDLVDVIDFLFFFLDFVFANEATRVLHTTRARHISLILLCEKRYDHVETVPD